MPKISEGTVALGLLALFALWLFVGLPFLYLPLRIECQPQCVAMVSANTFGFFLSFLGGSVAAWVLGLLFAHVRRPILSVQIVPHRGCYVTTSRGNPPTHNAKFLRLLIENKGRSSMNGCAGYITSITKIVNGVMSEVQQEVLSLGWSGGGTAGQLRTIPSGAFFYLDVAALDLVAGGSVLQLCVNWFPNHLAHLIQTSGTFELTIKVVAENVRPCDRVVRFEFNSALNDLQFGYD